MRTMRSIQTILLLALVAACEGEPPKTPAGGQLAVPIAAEPAAEPEGTAQAAAAPVQGAAPGAACGCCPCPGGAMAAGDAGVGEGGATATAAVPAEAPAATSSAITGTVTSASKPLPFAVVYLEDAPIDATAKMTAVINNRQMSFTPFVTVIPAGGKITFTNSDPFPHNVFSPDADKFNMGTINQNQGMVHVFPKPGAYSLLCNLHPGMLGYLVVAPSSYFGKADAKGHYTIKAVPPGTYKATAWAPRLATTTQPVVVKAGDATLDFELHR